MKKKNPLRIRPYEKYWLSDAFICWTVIVTSKETDLTRSTALFVYIAHGISNQGHAFQQVSPPDQLKKAKPTNTANGQPVDPEHEDEA